MRKLLISATVLWLACAPAFGDVIKTVQAGSTDQTVTLRLFIAADGTCPTGITYDESGMALNYWRHGANAVTAITEATQTTNGAHSDGGFVELLAASCQYRLDLPDAAVAAGATAVDVFGTLTDHIIIGGTVLLSPPVDVVAAAGTAWASGAITAASVANGAIDAATFAADVDAEVLSYIVDDATRIDASELNSDIDSLAFTVAGDVDANMQGISGDTTAADNLETAFDDTAGAVRWTGIVDQGTAQGAAATTIQIRAAAAFADDELIGANVLITGGSAGVGQTRLIEDYAGATDTATVSTWTTTPSGTITYIILSDVATGGSVSIGAGGITASSFAAGAIDATALAANAIGDSEIAAAAFGTDVFATGAIPDAAFATTAGAYSAQGVVDQGTAQAVTGTSLQLRSAAAFADDELIGATCIITGGSTGVGQSRLVTDYVSSTDTATVAAWTTTPTGTITYKCYGTAPGAGGLTQADVRSAVGLSSANLDTQLSAIDDYVDTEVAAILVDTSTTLDDFLDTEIADILTDTGTTLQGELDGIQADTEDLQTRVPAALVSGRIDSSVGAMAANVVTATAVADDAIDAGAIATDAITSAEVAASVGAELNNTIVGTCDSGSTTTCVDNALTQADATQLADRLICFDDSWCALISDFTPGTDTVTTTKTAPSTRGSKAYTIFPATTE